MQNCPMVTGSIVIELTFVKCHHNVLLYTSFIHIFCKIFYTIFRKIIQEIQETRFQEIFMRIFECGKHKHIEISTLNAENFPAFRSVFDVLSEGLRSNLP